MKRLIFTTCIATLIIFFAGCKKDHNAISTSIVGTWELRSVYGGYGMGGGNYSRGNGHIVKFSKTDYQYYDSNQLKKSGTYKIVKLAKETYINGDVRLSNKIIFDNDSGKTLLLRVANNHLFLYNGLVAADGTVTEYEKIK